MIDDFRSVGLLVIVSVGASTLIFISAFRWSSSFESECKYYITRTSQAASLLLIKDGRFLMQHLEK